MSKKTSYLLGIILTIIIGTFLYWKLGCCNCKGTKKEKTPIVVEAPKKIELAPFGIKEVNTDLLSNLKSQYVFGNSNFLILDSLMTKPKDVNDASLLIKEYLDKNGEKRFNITGYYSSDEVNNSAYPNLGLARANTVKSFMVKKGVSAKSINTFGELNDELKADANNILYNSIDFNLIDKDDETAKLELEALMKSCEALKSDPLILYFQSGQAAINLSAAQREKFSKITNCVDKLGAKVEVVGHTDNTGDPAKNMELGQGRADFAKGYLVKNGILGGNIDAISKGQTEPISDNATSAGRAKNRRTVVTIK